MKKLIPFLILHFSFSILHSFSAQAESATVADCVRDSKLDYWASADVRYCTTVMHEVFVRAGLETERVEFGADGLIEKSKADVICSAFRTPELSENYVYPLQPIGCMHCALYATPQRSMAMMSQKITEWPRLRVGYSPVSQGQNTDREHYFEQARLTPKYVEYPTSAGAVDALQKGEIDVLFLYTPFGKRPEGLVEVVPIGDRNVYFAVRKDKNELYRKLVKAYREVYIDDIDRIDEWKETILGLRKPQHRVRAAAYCRGGLFNVAEDGTREGALDNWLKTICTYTRWTVDFVYGGYDESLEDVKNGRLDLVGGIGFSPSRRNNFLFPHTPIGMLRVYLWAHPGSPYKPGDPATWRGMKVGLLSGTVSAERAKRQFDADSGISYKEFSSDLDMLNAYFAGEVDACVDVEMPGLANEEALHIYTAHPMYICTSTKRPDLFSELEQALDEVCDDFPKYQRMISEHHYGDRSNMAALSLQETQWLKDRVQSSKPVYIDFSPWPYPLIDSKGRPDGFVGALLAEMSRRTGLIFLPQAQTGIQTAEAKFMRGETDFWVPYPAKSGPAVYAATPVYSLPVPQTVAKELGCADHQQEFEMFARRDVPVELVSIIRKVLSDIDPSHLQEMFFAALAETHVEHRIFGMTRDELVGVLTRTGICIVGIIAIYGIVMGALLRRQVKRANRAAAAAEEMAQAKTRFLAMMSHELRTPLNAVVGFAEFLSRPDIGEERRREYTEGILLSSNALLELINDILDLSKLDAGAMDMRSGACDMNKLLKELPAIFGYRVRRHGVKLRVLTDSDRPIPVLEFYQQGMRQILINLVGNAAKFTEKGEIVVMATWLEETSTLHVEIRDTGCGISDEKMARLFDPFVQDIASRINANEGDKKGTGLGLPIVKRMVESAKGTITVHSTLGKGTTFLIDIPGLKLAKEQLPSVKSAAAAITTVLPQRVLVVDDMQMNRKILGIHLGNFGIKEIRYADNGCNALEVMREWRPDLVLTDMWMPKMDGTQLAEAMRKDRELAEIPIVAVTADVDVGSSYDMSLFADVMSKPVTGEKLSHLFGRA